MKIEDIEYICNDYNIKNYTINDDGSIDVDGGVNLSYSNLTKLPLRFNKVTWNFMCNYNRLTSLVGCPKEVGGDFYCNDNKLTSLVGCPIKIGGGFDCENNEITSLEHCPKEVGGDFYCRENKITDLTGLNKFGGLFYCDKNPIEYIFNDVEQDFTYAFQVYQVINGKEVNLKRLKYVMSTWNLPIDIEKIKEYYKLV